MAKEDWKKAGKGLGSAFAGLGKTIVRSAEQTFDDVTDWAKKDKKEKTEETKDAAEEVKAAEETAECAAEEAAECAAEEAKDAKSTVYNDGSWRKTGKALGGAFADLGRAFVKTVDQGVDKAGDALDEHEAKREAQKEAKKEAAAANAQEDNEKQE